MVDYSTFSEQNIIHGPTYLHSNIIQDIAIAISAYHAIFNNIYEFHGSISFTASYAIRLHI